MTVLISGKLIGPNGDPRSGVTIMLTAVKTSSAVIQYAPSVSVTSSDGSYSLSVQVGTHNVMIEADGRPFEKAGQIKIYSDSLPGTLNDFLIAPGESELTPEIVQSVDQMRVLSQKAVTDAENAKNRAYDESRSAIDNAIRESGYTPVDSFEDGFTLTNISQALRLKANNAFYSWRGEYPKVVPTGSTPETTGGFASNAWVDVNDLTLRSQLASASGAALVKRGAASLDSILEVFPEQFGAVDHRIDEDFDCGPALRAAIDYLNARGGGVVQLRDRQYNVRSVGPTKYTLPYDDGSVSPLFVAMGGDSKIDSETVVEMPVFLDVPSNVGFRGYNPKITNIDFGWNYSTGGIDTNQGVGIVFRTDNNDRMTGYVRGTELTGFSIRRAFIGFITDGVLYSHQNWGNMNFRLCAIPGIIQGIDSIQFTGLLSIEACYAGLVIGGMWLQRNNTTAGGEWVPPYVAGTDVYALGWADAFNMPKLTASYSEPYGEKHRVVDRFFDDYFFKERNSKKFRDGGRLSNNVNGSSARPDLTQEKYRGICHRALSIFSRYFRGNCNLRISELKIWGCSRVPILTTAVTGNDWYGRVEYAYSERTGFVNPNQSYSPANDWYGSGSDPYNADYSQLPAAVAEGAMGAVQVCLQGMPRTIGSTKPAPQNTPYSQNIWVRNLSELTPTGGVPAKQAVRRVSAYATDGSQTGAEIERLAIGRLETQPIAFYSSDQDQSHQFKHRVVTGSDMQLRNDGAQVAAVSYSVIYIAGRVQVFLKCRIPANAAALTGVMNINWLPKTDLSANFGSTAIAVSVLNANIVSFSQRPVYNTSGVLIGNASVPKEIKGAAMDTDQYLNLYDHPSKGTKLKISDFSPNTILELKLEYNGLWNIF